MKKTCVFLRKSMTCLVVMLLALVGANLINANGGVVHAEETIGSVYMDTTIAEAPDFIAEYTQLTEEGVAPTAITEGYEDWLFAGWYSAKECTDESVIKNKTAVSGAAWAKYVPADVLSVKVQVKNGTEASTTSTNMRFVSSVDTLNYASVGFMIEHHGDTVTQIPVSTGTVFRHIVASEESGVDFEYNAKVVDAKSEWFITATLANISSSKYNDTFVIRPYWTTYDGTTVYGPIRYVKVSDAYNNIVNIPVVVDENSDVASLTVDGVAPSEVRYYNGEEYAELMIAVSDRSALASLTKYTVSDGQVGYYRNLLSSLGTVTNGIPEGDESWYLANTDAYEFVIANAADLYGLATLADSDDITWGASGKNPFEGKTIYLGSDITVNENTPTTAEEWKTYLATNTPTYNWEPIGSSDNSASVGRNRFAGYFDGMGQTIRGIYYKDATSASSANHKYAGLFGYIKVEGTVANFRLEDSYFECGGGWQSGTSNYALLGSVVGQLGGTLEGVYSNAVVVSPYAQTGGMISRVNSESVDTPARVSNCWYAGSVVVTKDTMYDYDSIGGFLGNVTAGKVEITNCLYTGNLSYTYTTGTTNKFAGVGAFIGSCNNDAEISDSVCLGTLTAQDSNGVALTTGVGSFVGTTKASKNATINNCYTILEVTGEVDGMGVNGTFTRTQTGTAAVVLENDLKGDNAYIYTELDFYSTDNEDGIWAVVDEKMPVLKGLYTETVEDDFSDLQKVSMDWYYNAKAYSVVSSKWTQGTTVFTILDGADLRGLAKLVNDGTTTFSLLTVQMIDDIVLNEGKATDWQAEKNLPTHSWEPIGVSAALSFQGTFEGNNHTISGLYMDVTRDNSGLFGYAKSATIQNLRMTNSFLKATNTTSVNTSNADTVTCVTNLGSISGYFGGTMTNVYSEAIIEAYGSRNGGLIGCANNATTMTSCWFDGTLTIDFYGSAGLESGGVIGYINASCAIDSCLYTGTMTTTNYRTNDSISYGASVGALIGTEHKTNGGTTITNCVTAGTITSTWNGSRYLEEGYTSSNNYASAKMVYFGRLMGAYRNASTTATNNYSSTTITVIVDFSKQSTTDTTYTKKTSTITAAASKVDNGIADALSMTSYADDVLEYVMPYYITDLSFERADGDTTSAIWAVRNTDAKPIPETMTDIVDDEVPVSRLATADTSWYDADETEFTLYDAADLYGFAVLAWTNNFSGKTVKLGNDITLNEGDAEEWASNGSTTTYLWTPIGGRDNSASRFFGTFDGQEYTITGLYAESDIAYMGLFGMVTCSETTQGVVKNVRLENSYLHSTGSSSFTGSVTGDIRGTLENIYSSAFVESDGSQVGGLVARSNGASYTPSGASQKARFTVTLTDCWFDGTVIVKEGSNAATYIGGISGVLVQGTANVTNCLYTGNIVSEAVPDSYNVFVGGLYGGLMAQSVSGYVEGSDSTLNLNSCVSSGTITSVTGEETYVASLIGMVTGTDAKWSYLSLANVYTDDSAIASYNVQVETDADENSLVTGEVIVGSEDYSGLDFESETGWMEVESGVPIPKAFDDVLATTGEE